MFHFNLSAIQLLKVSLSQLVKASIYQLVILISQVLIGPLKPNQDNQFSLIQVNCCSVVSPFHWGLKLAVLLWILCLPVPKSCAPPSQPGHHRQMLLTKIRGRWQTQNGFVLFHSLLFLSFFFF